MRPAAGAVVACLVSGAGAAGAASGRPTQQYLHRLQQQSCGLEKVDGHIYGSNHFDVRSVADANSCCAACAAAGDQCQAYTFEDATRECYLKDNQVDGGAESGRTSGRRNPPPPGPPPSCSVEAGIEYLGNDIAAPVQAADEGACCAACQGNAACLFFTFEGAASNNLCHLKNADAPDSQRPNATCTSGYVGTSPPAPPTPPDVAVALAAGALPRWTTSPHFVCWNIDASANRGFFDRNLSAAAPDLFGAQLARQVRARASECASECVRE
jgi:hypothetical protein